MMEILELTILQLLLVVSVCTSSKVTCSSDTDCSGLVETPYCNTDIGFCDWKPKLVGCYEDVKENRIFIEYDPHPKESGFNCGLHCEKYGFLRWGFDLGPGEGKPIINTCWCGNDLNAVRGTAENCGCKDDKLEPDWTLDRRALRPKYVQCVYASSELQPVYIGCYDDSNNIFPKQISAPLKVKRSKKTGKWKKPYSTFASKFPLQPLNCEDRCRSEGFLFFGTKGENECWCSNSLEPINGLSEGCTCENEMNPSDDISQCIYRPNSIHSVRVNRFSRLCEIEVFDVVGKRVELTSNNGMSGLINDGNLDSCSADSSYEGYVDTLFDLQFIIMRGILKNTDQSSSTDVFLNGGSPDHVLSAEDNDLLVCSTTDDGLTFSCKEDMSILTFNVWAEEAKYLCEIEMKSANSMKTLEAFKFGAEEEAVFPIFDKDQSSCVESSRIIFDVLYQNNEKVKLEFSSKDQSNLDGLHIFHSDNVWETTLLGGSKEVRIHERIAISDPEEIKSKLNNNANLYKTFELSSGDNITLDYDIPADIGLKITCTDRQFSSISLNQQVNVQGRLEIENCTVEFGVEGEIRSTGIGAVRFTDSFIDGVDRCETSSLGRVIQTKSNQGICLGIVDRASSYNGASSLCNEVFGSNLLSLQNVNYDDIKRIVPPPLSVWVDTDSEDVCRSVTWNNSVEEVSCKSFLPVVCNDKPKTSFSGNRLLCSSSRIIVRSEEELYYRLDNPEKMEDDKCKIYRIETNSNDFNWETFQISSTRPSQVRISIDLARGNSRHVSVAMDSLAEPKNGVVTSWSIDSQDKFPEFLQIHARDSMCIKSIRVDFNENQEKAFEYTASSFSECNNVCTRESNAECPKRLAFYDPDSECIVIGGNEALFSSDLAIAINHGPQCNRLSLWRHPKLGQHTKLVIETSNQAGSKFEVKPGNLPFKYEFENEHKVMETPLSLVTKSISSLVSVDLVNAEGEVHLKSLSIMRYGKVIMGWKASETFDCLNACPEVASSNDLQLSAPNKFLTIKLDILAQGCDKFLEGFTGLNTTGVEACTSPSMNFSNWNDIIDNLDYDVNYKYRTLTFELESPFENQNKIITVPKERGLILTGTNDPVLQVGGIRVKHTAVLEIANVNVNGSMSIENYGECELHGLDAETEGGYFLNNLKGASASVSAVNFFGMTEMYNKGELSVSYSVFKDNTQIVNDGGNLTISRLDVHNDFIIPEETLILPEGSRHYETANFNTNENDKIRQLRMLQGQDEKKLVTVSANTILDCFKACEATSDCFSVSHDIINQVCEMCTYDEAACSVYATSSFDNIHFIPKSQFDYFTLEGCLVYERDLGFLLEGMDFTVEECKLWCSYYHSCEGIVTNETFPCQHIGSLDIGFDITYPNCQKDTLLVPYNPNSLESFTLLSYTKLVDDSSPMSVYSDLDAHKCAKACEITLGCSAFLLVNSGECKLFDSADFEWTDNVDSITYLDLNDIYPANRYVVVNDCKLPGFFQKAAGVKTEEQCRYVCNMDRNCQAFAYPKVWNDDNTPASCYLYDIDDLINGVLGTNSLCDTQSGFNLHVAFLLEDFKIAENDLEKSFYTQSIINDVDIEECKSLCMKDEGCDMFQYNSSTVECIIGKAEYDQGAGSESYYLLGTKPSSVSTYVSTDACFSTEQISLQQLPADVFTFSHLPQQCVDGSDIWSKYKTKTVQECEAACRNDVRCVGFNYGVDYKGLYNSNKKGKCMIVSSADTAECDGAAQNFDFYMRNEIFACQLWCNLHPLCSGFSFAGHCELYSDVALTQKSCTSNEKRHIYVGVSTKFREALMQIQNACLVPFEELSTVETDCYFDDSADPIMGQKTIFPYSCTMHFCREHCRSSTDQSGRGFDLYGVKNGNECYCGKESGGDYTRHGFSTNCNSVCSGDPSQNCGGIQEMQVGRTNLPLEGVSVQECKATCYASRDCIAIIYNISSQSCEMHSSSVYTTEDCPTSVIAETELYIESLEHFYVKPVGNFFGKTVIDTLTTTRLGCQAICDAYEECVTIKLEESKIRGVELLKDNCILFSNNELYLVGDPNSAITSEELNGFFIASDISKYTRGFKPPSLDQPLATISNLFDIDECMKACEDHVLCGSMTYSRGTACVLYRITAFADTSATDTGTNMGYYIDYRYYIDPAKEFVEASNNGNSIRVCVSDTSFPEISARLTVQSEYDCGQYCNSVADCSLFTYDVTMKTCKLYNSSVTLEAPCTLNAQEQTAYIMFSRAKFTKAGDQFCLLNEQALGKKFTSKSVQECAALCDAWFDCRSFRHKEDTFTCNLFSSDDVVEAPNCLQHLTNGNLYLYHSDQKYTELPETFCVSSNDNIEVTGIPLEACKNLCSLYPDCLAFEHNEAGECALFRTNDFSSSPCVGGNRKLYISYSRIRDPTLKKYLYTNPQKCFDVSALTGSQNNCCRRSCSLQNDCYGYQTSSSGDCYLLQNGESLPGLVDCVNGEESWIRSGTNPYQKMDQTCLRNKIDLPKISNVTSFECRNLCDAHPYCRYFLHGDVTNGNHPEFRECILFQAQAYELDDCDDYSSNYDYYKKEAYVNGRTFIDQITWFGEPEKELATLSALTYQQCASVCDSINECLAFVHSWNYRRYGDSIEPELFTKARVIHHESFTTVQEAVFLKYDTETQDLVISVSNDDDINDQLVLLEETDVNSNRYRLKFWSANGLCLHGDTPKKAGTQNKLQKMAKSMFGVSSQMFCQKLLLDECSNSPLEIELVDDGKYIEMQYTDPSDSSIIGCIKLRPDEVQNTAPIDLVTVDQPMLDEVTLFPTTSPTKSPTMSPTTSAPTISPTTASPTESPTMSPSTSAPTISPTTASPTESPTISPSTSAPTFNPTITPTSSPNTNRRLFSFGSIFEDTWDHLKRKLGLSDIYRKVWQTAYKDPFWDLKFGFDFLFNDLQDYVQNLNTFETTCGTASSSNDKRVIFSSAYGKGCSFDKDKMLFPSQWWYFASEKLRMYSPATKGCLHVTGNNVYVGDCATAPGWTFVFGRNVLFYDDENNNKKMKCFHKTNAGAYVGSCDGDDTVFKHPTFDQQVYVDTNAGTIRRFENLDNDCLLANIDGTIGWGSCNAANAKWIRYSECKLNSRENTKPMKLENQGNGKCIDPNNGFVACTNAPFYKYSFEENKYRLEEVNSNGDSFSPARCLGRVSATDGSLTTVNCYNGASLNQHALWFIDGDENNIFRYNLVANYDFCMGSDDDSCSNPNNGFSRSEKWRASGADGDATEISVKPSATLQEITDPELLFQIWLYSAEGSLVRQLRSKVNSLATKVETVVPHLDDLIDLGDILDLTIAAGLSPISLIESGLNSAEKIFKIFDLILKIVEYIPTVGPIIRNTKLRFILKQIYQKLDQLGKGVGKVADRAEIIRTPIDTATGTIVRATNVLEVIIETIPAFVEKLAREMYCAFIDKLDFYQTARGWMMELKEVIGEVTNILSQVPGLVKPLKAVINGIKPILKAVKTVLNILAGVKVFTDSLSFLEVIYDFKAPLPVFEVYHKKICVKIPLIGKKCLNVPLFRIRTIKFGLEEIGELLDTVERLIRSIPGVGEVLTLLETAIDIVISALFKFNPFSFLLNIGTEIFGQIVGVFKDVTDRLGNLESKVLNLLSSQLLSRVADLGIVNKIKSAISSAAGAFDCPDKDCMISEVLNGFPEFQPINPVFFPDLNISNPVDLDFDFFEDILNNVPGIEDFFDSIECVDDEDIQVQNPIFPLGCPLEFTVCRNLTWNSSLMDPTALVTTFNDVVGRGVFGAIDSRRLDIKDGRLLNAGEVIKSWSKSVLATFGVQINLSIFKLVTSIANSWGTSLRRKFLNIGKGDKDLGYYMHRLEGIVDGSLCIFLPFGFEFCPRFDITASFTLTPFKFDDWGWDFDDIEDGTASIGQILSSWFDASTGGFKMEARTTALVRKRFSAGAYKDNKQTKVNAGDPSFLGLIGNGNVNIAIKPRYDASYYASQSYAYRGIYHIFDGVLNGDLKAYVVRKGAPAHGFCIKQFIGNFDVYTTCRNRKYKRCEAEWYLGSWMKHPDLVDCLNLITRFTKSKISFTSKWSKNHQFTDSPFVGPIDKLSIKRKYVKNVWEKEAEYLGALNRYWIQISDLSNRKYPPVRNSVTLPPPLICKAGTAALDKAKCAGNTVLHGLKLIGGLLTNAYYDWGVYDRLVTNKPYHAGGFSIDHEFLSALAFYIKYIEGHAIPAVYIITKQILNLFLIPPQLEAHGKTAKEAIKRLRYIEGYYTYFVPLVSTLDQPSTLRRLDAEGDECEDILAFQSG